MKKYLVLAVLIVGLIGLVEYTWAIDLGLESAKNAAAGAGYDAAGTTENTLAQTIGTFIRGILTVSGVIFTCLVFYAGFLWMTARGDEGQVEKSKEIIKAGVIGLTVALAAFGITNLVMRLVTGNANSGGGTPTSGGGTGICQAKQSVVAGCASVTTSLACDQNLEFSCTWTGSGCKADALEICPSIGSASECALSAEDRGCEYAK